MLMPDGKTPIVVVVMMTKCRNGQTIINKIRTVHAHGDAVINDIGSSDDRSFISPRKQ